MGPRGLEHPLPYGREAWTDDHEKGRHASKTHMQVDRRIAEPYCPPQRGPGQPLGVEADGEPEQFKAQEDEQTEPTEHVWGRDGKRLEAFAQPSVHGVCFPCAAALTHETGRARGALSRPTGSQRYLRRNLSPRSARAPPTIVSAPAAAPALISGVAAAPASSPCATCANAVGARQSTL